MKQFIFDKQGNKKYVSLPTLANGTPVKPRPTRYGKIGRSVGHKAMNTSK